MALLWRARTTFTGNVVGGGLNVSHWLKEPLLGTAGVEGRISDFWNAMKGLLTTELTITGEPTFDVVDVATGEIVDAVGVDGWTGALVRALAQRFRKLEQQVRTSGLRRT